MLKRNNIVYIIDGLGMGGAERLMIPVLKYLDRGMFYPRVCVLQDKDGNPIADELRQLGVQVDFLPVSYLREFSAVPRIRSYLQNVNANLVHTQLEFGNILGGIAAKSLGLPCVSTVHTIPSLEKRRKMKLHNMLELFILRVLFDVTIAVSEETRNYYVKFGRLNSTKVKTIYNGIDLSQFIESQKKEKRGIIRAELQIPSSARLIITVAVLRELKGIQYMLRAFPALLKKHPNTYYLIVGDGMYRETLVGEVEKLGLQRNVIFVGRRMDIPQLLSASDVFVLPTLTEALPTVLAEAMAAKLPVVACAVGGIPEMITEGVNGKLIPSKDPQALTDACEKLLDNPEQTTAMGEAGWQIVEEKFNITTQVNNLKELYLSLLSS
ncbi:MAG: glycosyltransferase [Anaerolineales bacterium]|nr:glycosyltransferase [Anaerolineales bacterium]